MIVFHPWIPEIRVKSFLTNSSFADGLERNGQPAGEMRYHSFPGSRMARADRRAQVVQAWLSRTVTASRREVPLTESDWRPIRPRSDPGSDPIN